MLAEISKLGEHFGSPSSLQLSLTSTVYVALNSAGDGHNEQKDLVSKIILKLNLYIILYA